MVWSPPSKPVQQISLIRFWPGSSSENESNESPEEFTKFPLSARRVLAIPRSRALGEGEPRPRQCRQRAG